MNLNRFDRTGEQCPTCNKGKLKLTSQEGNELQSRAGYLCDQCSTTHAMFHSTFEISLGLTKIKIKDQNRRPTVKSTFTIYVEKRFSMMPSDAIQIVWGKNDRKILHIHCKARGCGNEWKLNEKTGYESKFTVQEIQSVVREIKCLRCNRTYKIS
jgi:hypothetical protein